MKSAEMVDEVNVHSVSGILVFILVVEGNSIGSQAIEGGNFHIRQNDALSGMEVGDIRSQTSNVRKQA